MLSVDSVSLQKPLEPFEEQEGTAKVRVFIRVFSVVRAILGR